MSTLEVSVFWSAAATAAGFREKGPETRNRGEVSELSVLTAAVAVEARVGTDIVRPVSKTVAGGTAATSCESTGDLESILARFGAGEQCGVEKSRSGGSPEVGTAPRWEVAS